jgi:Superfamily I DNA and RNA helicases
MGIIKLYLMTKILESLNEKQKEAVFWVDGSSLILAGAGSGKTRVLGSKSDLFNQRKKSFSLIDCDDYFYQ